MGDSKIKNQKPTYVVLWFAVLTLGGCDRGADAQFAVSGRVTYDNQPVTNGTIGFVPEGSSPSPAKTVGADLVDGSYRLPRHEGPVAGTYKVLIFAERPSGQKIQADEGSSEMVDMMVPYIPPEYNERTNLTVEISADRDDLDFDLKKPERPKRRRKSR